MKTLLGLCAVLFYIASPCKAGPVCTVPETQTANVISLSLNMARSVGPCVTPDPSVLMALNLGQMKDSTVQEMLVDQLKKDAVKKISTNEPFTSGKVALYVLALRSSCADPTAIPASGGSVDLVQTLKTKTDQELQCFTAHQQGQYKAAASCPLTTWYQVSLDVLALCVMSKSSAISAADVLAKHITPNAGESLDTAAVAVMAFSCVLGMNNVPSSTRNPVESALSDLLKYFFRSQTDGWFGNAYSTSLVAQALTAAQGHYSPQSWNCSKTLQAVLGAIPQKTYDMPIAAAQVLPFLSGGSYVSIKGLQCTQNNVAMISVGFSIANYIVENHFQYSITVSVKDGDTVLQVMEKAAAMDPKNFSFQSETSAWGVFITEINHLAGSSNAKTYWQFFSVNTPLTVGVDQYKPKNNDRILAIFSTY